MGTGREEDEEEAPGRATACPKSRKEAGRDQESVFMAGGSF